MLSPLLIATLLSALCTTATARMVPPWAKDLPNWKHYKLPQQQQQQQPHHPARDIPAYQRQSTLAPTSDSPPTTYDFPSHPEEDVPDMEEECPIVCIDAINECGIRYGDCVHVCPGEKPKLTVPPCPPAAWTGEEVSEAGHL